MHKNSEQNHDILTIEWNKIKSLTTQSSTYLIFRWACIYISVVGYIFLLFYFYLI